MITCDCDIIEKKKKNCCDIKVAALVKLYWPQAEL